MGRLVRLDALQGTTSVARRAAFGGTASEACAKAEEADRHMTAGKRQSAG
jgi:hypothetical protein